MDEVLRQVMEPVLRDLEGELWGKAMPTNWPPCPHHPNGHPTKVATRDATAVWVCPIDATLVAIVGSVNE